MLGATIRTLTLSVAAAVLCGCTTYVPYAVQDLRPPEQADQTLPVLNKDPVEVTPDHRVFATADGSKTFQIPSSLVLSVTPTGRDQAIALRSEWGDRLVLIANLAPTRMADHPLYPISQLDLRIVTDVLDPNAIRVSTVSGSSSTAPFSAIVVIQVFGKKSIAGFESLLQTGAGFLLEAHFNMAIERQGIRSLSIPVSLDQARITTQSM